MTPLSEMDPRELVRRLMRGNAADLKLGYSARNAALAVERYHPNEPNLLAYAAGFADGMIRDGGSVRDEYVGGETPAYDAGYLHGTEERGHHPASRDAVKWPT